MNSIFKSAAASVVALAGFVGCSTTGNSAPHAPTTQEVKTQTENTGKSAAQQQVQSHTPKLPHIPGLPF